MKKRVLIPVDFSQGSLNALEHGIFIANAIDAYVRIMHVRAEKKFAVPFNFKEIERQNVKSAKDFCEILVEKYRKSVKNDLDYKLREGKVYEEVVNQAKYSDIYHLALSLPSGMVLPGENLRILF
ncbi:MAG: universal stress protein [Bacteroidia bacterium]|nr:universal stress protein [Bacteroidia bacterium]